METIVTNFVRVLRNAEIRVSPAETLDALRALELVGYGERESVRLALAATLTKTVEEKQLFDECFARFFGGVPGGDAPSTDAETSDTPDRPATSAAATLPSSPPLEGLAALLLAGDAMQLQIAIANAGRATGVQEIRIFTQRGLFTRRILEALGWQQLQSDILDLEQASPDNVPGRTEGLALKRRAEQLRDQVRDFVEQQYLMFAGSATRELRESVLREARLSNLERRDLDQINRLVRRIARKLATRYARRRRRFRRGQLDVPRTIRGGVPHDGLLFEPRWKSQRHERPDILVVCDVSGSVRAYARFLLLFLYGLSDVLPRVRSFVFSFEFGEVSQLFENDAPEIAIDLAQRQWGGGSTDYARAFRGLLESAGRELDRGATVVMLGDGRNNYGDPAMNELREIGRRSRRLFWLNPESESAWGSGDSEMLRYRACCTEARSCRSIAQLERFADDLLRSSW